MKLSILIPVRSEEFLQQTLEDIEKHKRGDTEVLWEEDPGIGQRALTNKLAEKAKGEYLMKLDAHCSMSQGFDVELLKAATGATVAIPALCNLYAYDWMCENKHKRPCEQFENYDKCEQCGGEVKKEVVWRPIPSPVMTDYYFDTNLHFQYSEEQSEELENETMSIQGSCFVISKENYFKLNICDERFGSWGQQGVEVALKAWLSGGNVVATKNAFYAHWFRTFPYKNPTEDILKTQKYSRDLFLNNKWPNQVKPIQWLIRKFGLPGDWTPEKMEQLCAKWK